ncbi:hypothetical protein MLD38_027183 [Melastoma candidum]|uniref:Uncharacterized protein n=2 Tax=Melastoma candidum TaxID=119954 RepID=A0ACB9P1U5_9MYRT|nr:hypothetical protein MLD38_027183 [Melastoma candidum]
MWTGLLLAWLFPAAYTRLVSAFCCFALTPNGVALLEFKNALNDSKNYLSNWNPSNASPCKWTGITCNANGQRVQVVWEGLYHRALGNSASCRLKALHSNSLHGSIPVEIANCTDLRPLYLRGNYLQGGIPAALGNLLNLFILDLSSNSLKGAISTTIGRLTRLPHLNLSTNFFTGEIPNMGVLGNFGRNLFVGNLDLCGQQVLKPCRTSLGFPAVLPHAESEKRYGSKEATFSLHQGILIGAGSTLGASIAVVVLFLSVRRHTKKERAATKYRELRIIAVADVKLLTFHGDMPYPSSEIIEKLESLNEEDIVGSGGFGTVYRMVMSNCGMYAVKKIDRRRDWSDQVFEREVEILGGIKHINLVNLRGYCRHPGLKLLIYDFLAMGSLDDLLHGKFENQPLNWSSPLKIALGSARGLAFSHLTTVVAGTFGYLAPEYLQSGIATEKSNVYSFGVLLLELVTGKRPTDPSFLKRGLNVIGWMHNLLRDNRLEDVVDKRCTGADAETVELLLDIAARCTDANPDERPSMNRVLQSLEQEAVSPYWSDFWSQSDYC